jgi:hypothetical protein
MKLKPCPFCRAKPEKDLVANLWNIEHEKDCFISAIETLEDYEVKPWNTRKEPTHDRR